MNCMKAVFFADAIYVSIIAKWPMSVPFKMLFCILVRGTYI